MPAHSPGHRLAMEAALEPEDLDALLRQAEALGVPRSSWHRVPWFSRPWANYAAACLIDRLRAEGETAERALLAAVIRLGLNENTLTDRLRCASRVA